MPLRPLQTLRPASLLIRAGRCLDNIRRRRYTEFALGPTQRDALLIIQDARHLSQADLARRLGCAPCVVSRLVARLLVLGVVDRVPDRGGRTRFVLSTSRYGRTFLPEIADERDELELVIGWQLGNQEIESLVGTLTRTVSTLDHVLRLPPEAEIPPRHASPFPKGLQSAHHPGHRP